MPNCHKLLTVRGQNSHSPEELLENPTLHQGSHFAEPWPTPDFDPDTETRAAFEDNTLEGNKALIRNGSPLTVAKTVPENCFAK